MHNLNKISRKGFRSWLCCRNPTQQIKILLRRQEDSQKLAPHEALLEFCPELSHDPEYQWKETVHHADKISTDNQQTLLDICYLNLLHSL